MICPKILYKIDFKIKTAIHIGSGEEINGNANFFKNGKGDLFIPGSSIAGVFFERLESLNKNIKDNNFYKELTQRNKKIEEKDKNEEAFEASRIIFKGAVIQNPYLKVKNRIKIDNPTKTAEDTAKFSYWQVEPSDKESDFSIFLEIDNISKINKYLSDKDLKDIETSVDTVIKSWKKEGFKIGAFSNSGNGWCELKNYFKIKLDSKEKFKNYLEKRESIFDEKNKIKDPNNNNNNVKKVYKKFKLKIKIIDEDDGYGTNGLLIKGSDIEKSLNSNNNVDSPFINTGKKLYIPGSSVKGAFNSFFEKYGANKSLYENWKEVTGQKNAKNYEDKKAGKVVIKDLFIIKYDFKNLIQIERHKEDEFTRAIFGSGKFNEERLFNSCFEGDILIKKSDYNDKIDDLINFLKQGMQNRLISLGSNHCFPVFELKEVTE
jgi:CRISPR/Cas system CSM-associated protein Csm3 (group 7 of RAMP superfamily)